MTTFSDLVDQIHEQDLQIETLKSKLADARPSRDVINAKDAEIASLKSQVATAAARFTALAATMPPASSTGLHGLQRMAASMALPTTTTKAVTPTKATPSGLRKMASAMRLPS